MRSLKTHDILIVGAGPAGLMAAVTAAEHGANVALLERNGIVGKKLNITGKGRCNILNNCAPDTVIKNTPRNGKFLYSSLNRLTPAQTYQFFEENGLPLKTERGNRVFPVSDKATDVTETFRRLIRQAKISVLHGRATDICVENDGVRSVVVSQGNETYEINCKAIILATGGVSYPGTGSTGDGYKLAGALGHHLVEPRASIVPLESSDACCAEMQGLALKNVGVKAYDKEGTVVYEDFGELLFTHFGISGPTVLSLSAHLRDFDTNRYTVSIDLKPALDEKKLDDRILRDLALHKNRNFANSLGGLLPSKMIGIVIAKSGIDPEKPVHSIEKAERQKLLSVLKDFRIEILKARSIDEAVVTSGGIDVKEINPNTMQSRMIRGLFFAGEIIDVDAYTGGFNLQIAWSTGYAAGVSAAESI